MADIDVSPEFADILAQDEKTAQLVERTALAIFIGSVQRVPATSVEEQAWLGLWTDAAVETRIRCRNQARAALAASKLLKRVEELERAINTARSHLHDLDYQCPSVAAAEQVLNRAAEPKS